MEFNPEATDVPTDVEVIDRPDGEGSILTGISVEPTDEATTVQTVASWVSVPEGGAVEVLDADGEPVDTSAPVGTGMVIEVVGADGEVLQRTTVVVKGDVTGSGEINLTQLVRMAQGYSGTDPLTGVYAEAADLNGDGQVSLTDLVLEARLYKAAGLSD